jgi:hypothetical protein
VARSASPSSENTEWGPIVGLGLGAGYLKFGGWDAMWVIDLAGRLYPFKSLAKGELYCRRGGGETSRRNGEKSWQETISERRGGVCGTI